MILLANRQGIRITQLFATGRIMSYCDLRCGVARFKSPSLTDKSVQVNIAHMATLHALFQDEVKRFGLPALTETYTKLGVTLDVVMAADAGSWDELSECMKRLPEVRTMLRVKKDGRPTSLLVPDERRALLERVIRDGMPSGVTEACVMKALVGRAITVPHAAALRQILEGE